MICVIGGAGGVGSAVAASLVAESTAGDICLVDTARDALAVQLMDLELLGALSGPVRVRSGTLDDARDAAIVVMAASVPHRDGASRMAFLHANGALLHTVLDAIGADWSGTVLMATNPVDPLCLLASARLPNALILGYTVNDSLRLAQGIAAELGCASYRVSAWALGEHGLHIVPLFERTTVDDEPVMLSAVQQSRALRYAEIWYGRWQGHGTGRTSMWTTGAGIAQLIASFTGPPARLMPASVPLSGEYGIDGSCVSVPVRLGGWRASVVEWSLRSEQLLALRTAADAIAAAADEVVRVG